MKKIIVFILVASIVTSCHRDLRRPDERKDDFIHIGKKEKIQSTLLGEERPFWVYVPPYSARSKKTFSVLYLLDGDAHFHSVSGLIQILGTGVNGINLVPEMIVVAIPNTDRTRDLTPSHSTMMDGEEHDFLKSSGGGDKFLQFIKTELIPYVEKAYPTNPYRVLVGHSFGGIATINALYTMPETFDAYIAIDPSFWWDNQLLLKKASTVFSTNKFENKYLYLGQANTLAPGQTTNEHFGSIKEFVKVLESSSNTSGIHWSYKYYPEDSHSSVTLITEYDGLRFIFKDFNPPYEKIGLDYEKLKAHFAQYRMPPPEGVVNNLGYSAMEQNKLDLAEKFFQMNIDSYGSSNSFDSMGELLLTKGDTAQAVQSYKRSVELDPENQHAATAIKDILARKSR
jgi:predicted alpha/beta superfamily hydrolase